MQRKHIYRLKALLVSVLITIFLGVTLQTQMVIAGLNNLGANIDLRQTLAMSAYDLIYLSRLYGLFICIALMISFLAGDLIYRFIQFGRSMIYTIAGGTAMFVMLFSMKNAFFGVHLIAGASDTFGIMLQVIAGMIGGFVFARLSRKSALQKAQEKSPVIDEAL